MKRFLMRFPSGLAKAVTLSYDDGIIQDVKLVKIMNKHGLKGTFNINTGKMSELDVNEGGGVMSCRQMIELYKNSGHEVAVHTYTHPHLDELTPELITDEIMRDRRNIEEMFGCTARGMAYPYGKYNDTVIECMKACSIAYSRTDRSSENFRMPTDWLRLNATCHHNNPKLFALAEKFLSAEVRPALSVCSMFYLWGHSYEFDNFGNWEVIERFGELVGGRADIWYATNIEICDYVSAYHNLRFSIDRTFVENPTATELWFDFGGKIYNVKPSEKLCLSGE